jgi:RNA polymerase sigma-32 factor
MTPARTVDRPHRRRATPVLDAEAQRELARRYRATGDRRLAARLVEANLALVSKIAASYPTSGIALADLEQEGSVGLVRALDHFDPERGVKFSSYAALWIRAHVLRYLIENFRLVRLGTNQAQRHLFYNLAKERRQLERMGVEVTPAALAERLRTDEQQVMEMQQRMSSPEASIDAPSSDCGDGQPRAIGVRLVAPDELRPDRQAERHELEDGVRARLDAIVRRLDERERLILHERWLAEEPRSLQEIGDRLGITRERVRQLEERLLAHLRAELLPEVQALAA